MQYNYQRIDQLLKSKKGESRTILFSKCGITATQYNSWKKGTSSPSDTQMFLLARHLGVPLHKLKLKKQHSDLENNPLSKGDFVSNAAYNAFKRAGFNVSHLKDGSQKQSLIEQGGSENSTHNMQNASQDLSPHTETIPIRQTEQAALQKLRGRLKYYDIMGPLLQLPVLETGQSVCPFCKHDFKELLPLRYIVYGEVDRPIVKQSLGRACPHCKTIAFDMGTLRQIKKETDDGRIYTYDITKCKTRFEAIKIMFIAPRQVPHSSDGKSPLPYEEYSDNKINISTSNVVVRIYAQKCHCEKCKTKYNRNTIRNKTAVVNTVLGDTISLNVMFCMGCGQYFLNHQVFRQHQKNHGGLLAEFSLSSEMAKTGLSNFDFAQDSILSRCGYTVKEGTTKIYRHAVLRYILDAKKATKYEIIELITSFIEFRRHNPMYDGACRRWREDLKFVSDYQIATQEVIYNPRFLQGGKLRP